jgi:hypothetical protein
MSLRGIEEMTNLNIGIDSAFIFSTTRSFTPFFFEDDSLSCNCECLRWRSPFFFPMLTSRGMFVCTYPRIAWSPPTNKDSRKLYKTLREMGVDY